MGFLRTIKSGKLNVVLQVLMALALVASFILCFAMPGEITLFNVIVAILTFAFIWFLNYFTRLKISDFVYTLLLIFMIGALILGKVYSFYTRFSLWDTALHFYWGVIIVPIGYEIITAFNKKDIAKCLALPAFALCILAIANFTGALWEMFEYMGDWMFGFTSQNGSLVDTMEDINANFVGSFISTGWMVLMAHKSTKKEEKNRNAF